MLTDAHCHPFDLASVFPAEEDERRRLGIICAASASSLEEFEYCEQLPKTLPCFALHPQMPAIENNFEEKIDGHLDLLDMLAGQGRLSAVGETGFDFYNEAFRETEKLQERLFIAHLETALRYGLPVVLHVRRAMNKVFAHSKILKKCNAVIFHSWSGTEDEGLAVLRHGINAYFSFGNAIMMNHKKAMRSCAYFPIDRLLSETDAPYQPLCGREFSVYADLYDILGAIASLRQKERGYRKCGSITGYEEMENIIEINFKKAFLQ